MPCGTPGPSRSAHRATPSSAGRPTRGPGCPPCRGWVPTTPCHVAAKPCTGVPSFMASHSPRHRIGRASRRTEASPESAPQEQEEAVTEAPEAPQAPAQDDEPTPAPEVSSVGARLRTVLLPRLPRLVVSLVAGLLLFYSFPTLNWWWAAVVALALLAWVLTRPATTVAGGLGYGFLFGLAFYLPLLPWISTLVGAMPWLVLAAGCALFPGLFGLFAVVVRRLPGWPLWFALLWAAQEWLKSIFPFGGFPWGSVAFGQADGPLLPLVQLGGVALLSTSGVLVGCSLTPIALE